MATTIQVSDTTRQVLEMLKKEEQATSFDEVIHHLVQEHDRVAKSMLGAVKGLKWKKHDRMKFHDL